MEYCIENKDLHVVINNIGAELTSLYEKNTRTEYIWQGDKQFWDGHAPLLFPIVGRLPNNEYHYFGKHFYMTIHGFAKTSSFELVSAQEETLVLKFCSTPETLQIYPFHFELISKFTLYGKTLTIERIVINRSNCVMPYSIGEHIGFNVPLEKQFRFDDYGVYLSESETLPVRNALSAQVLLPPLWYLKEDNRLPLTPSLFNHGANILLDLVSRSVKLQPHTGMGASVSVTFHDHKHLGLWSIPNADFLCIEPWNGYPATDTWDGDIMHKPGIQKLQPLESSRTRCEIQIYP